jgi:hypothetical protein
MSIAARWELDETSGTVAEDSVGGFDGAYVDTPALGRPSMVPALPKAASVETESGNEYVSMPHNPFLQFLQGFTIKLWYIYQADGGYLVEKGADEYSLFVDGAGKLRARFKNSGGVVREVSSANGAVPVDEPCCIHVAFHKNTALRIYVNGVKVAESAVFNEEMIAGGGGNLAIGREVGAATQYSRARYQRVELYNHGMTTKEVEENFAADSAPPPSTMSVRVDGEPKVASRRVRVGGVFVDA